MLHQVLCYVDTKVFLVLFMALMTAKPIHTGSIGSGFTH